ncbi:hypothetical protein [Streptomyces sp. NPDC057545]|uniref:hypothetical protein n=1 Tax=Streptomyces sp. NPDC057545 TaxID=3346164 RepID=UPI0036C6220E
MSTLRARRMVRVYAFRASAGPIATWSGHQIEVYLDLISSADDARWHRARTAARRFKVIAAVAYIAPLYALLEVVGRGRPWRGLDRHISRMDRRLGTAYTACSRAGDHDFTALVSRTVTGIRDWVGQIAARLARG